MQYDISVKFPFPINNPEDAKRALEVMEKILKPLIDEILQRRLIYSFEFRIGNIHCLGVDRNEFIREIFGQTDFYLHRMLCIVCSSIEKDATATLSLLKYENWELKISSPSKDILIALERSYNIAVNETTNPPNKTVAIGTYIDQSQHVSIGGDANNAVIGSNNTVENSGEKSSFWKPILQSLIANWIWWALGIVIAVIVSIAAYLVKLKQG